MTHLLQARATDLPERMDDPDCDPDRLRRTYAQFALTNALFGGWGGLYRRHVRPALADGARSVLDVGCGGGDLLRRLARWAERDGFPLQGVGIDPDPRAIDFARSLPPHPRLTFQADTSRARADTGQRFDIVLSNHVLHHLSDDELRALCDDTGRIGRHLVLHNDLRRSSLAHALFPAVGLVCRGSFIVEDGLLSIQRAYRPDELARLAPPGWRVAVSAPFRLQLLRRT